MRNEFTAGVALLVAGIAVLLTQSFAWAFITAGVAYLVAGWSRPEFGSSAEVGDAIMPPTPDE